MIEYRGDTFWRTLTVKLDDGDFEFQEGNSIKACFVDNDGNKKLLKEILISEPTRQVEIMWTSNEMATLDIQVYILEIELTTSDFVKTYQEPVNINKDFIL